MAAFDLKEVTSGMTPQEIGDSLRSGRTAKSRTEMKAITGLTAGDVVYLSEGGRSGTFEYLVGDYSAEVAADTLEGVYVELDGVDASVGVLKRKLDGFVTQNMFGGDASAALTFAKSNNLRYFENAGRIQSGCVIRNEGAGWGFIDDENHIPFLFNALDVNVTQQYSITIERSIQAESRVSCSATVDETLALVGLTTGPSVNDDDVRLKMAAPLTSRFAATSTPTLIETSSFHSSHTSISWDSVNHFFEYSHLSTGLSGQPSVCYNFGAYTVVEEPIIASAYRVNNTLTRIALYMPLTINLSWNGSSFTISNREIGRNGDDETGYSATWDSVNHKIVVSHPEIATREFNSDLVVSCNKSSGATGFYTANPLTNSNRTSFELELWDNSAGARVQTTLPSGINITVKRGMYRLPRPTGGHISVSLPYTQIDPVDVISSGGNIWITDDERY